MHRWSEISRARDSLPQGAGGGISSIQLRPGMQLVLSDMTPADDLDCTHRETEDTLAIGFHLRGGFGFRFENGRRHTTRPLDCWMGGAPQGAVSTFSLPADGFRTVSIRLTPEVALSLLEPAEPRPCRLVEIAKAASSRIIAEPGLAIDSDAAATLATMLDAAFGGAARRLHLESCALSLLARQLRGPEPSPFHDADRQRIARAREHLNAHLDEPPTILELARLCGVNDFKLKRDFKRIAGTTIFGYIRERRLERAAERLRQGLSVQQAAAEVGYACPSRFAQAFRRRFGVVPSALCGEIAPA